MTWTNVLGRLRNKLLSRSGKPRGPEVEAAIRCHKGNVREENQDRAASFVTPLGALFVVADGVGGLESGALAAETVAQGFGTFLRSASSTTDPKTTLQMAMQKVNESIRKVSVTAQKSMASTVALVLLRHDSAFIGHAGDSRVYLVRDGGMYRMTRDHSVVQKMVDHGIISDSQSRSHPDASVLTRSMGQDGAELELAELPLLDGDALLLCSDGLWGYVEEEAIRTVASSASLSVEQKLDALLNLALEAGGGDNISIIFLKLKTSLLQDAS